MRQRGLLSLILLVLVMFQFPILHAGIVDHPYSFSLGMGGIQPALNDSAQIWLSSPYFHGAAQIMIRNSLGLTFGFQHAKIYNDSVSTSILKFSNDRANRRWLVNTVSAGAKFYFGSRRHSVPYLITRMDLILWNISSHPDNEIIVIENAEGSDRDYEASEFGITGGIGIEKALGDRWALSIESELTYLTGLGTDFAQWVRNSRSRALFSVGIGVSYHFGILKTGSTSEVANIKPDVIRHQGQAIADSNIQVMKAESDTVRVIPPSEYPPIVDADRDGVIDSLDLCGDTPAKALVDSAGCPMDSDRDGVFDGLDICDYTDSLETGYVDSTGCVVDADSDNTPDYRDKCLATPASIPVDSLGCPDFDLIFVKRVFHDLFNSGESRLKIEAAGPLDSIALLMEMFDGVTMTVYSYTDDVGPADANLRLSQKRADAVKSYFRDLGIDESRISSAGRGESNFMASNRTRKGRELNRRIELEFSWK